MKKMILANHLSYWVKNNIDFFSQIISYMPINNKIRAQQHKSYILSLINK